MGDNLLIVFRFFKVSKSEEDATDRRIRETLGDYKQAISTFFGNSVKPGSLGQRSKVSHKPLSSIVTVNSESGQGHSDNYSSQKSVINGKLLNGVSATKDSSSKQPEVQNNPHVKPPLLSSNQPVITNSQDKYSQLSKEKVHHFSNHDRTEVNSAHLESHQRTIDSDIPVNKFNQVKPHNSAASKDNSLKLSINKVNDVAKKAAFKDVESILQVGSFIIFLFLFVPSTTLVGLCS